MLDWDGILMTKWALCGSGGMAFGVVAYVIMRLELRGKRK